MTDASSNGEPTSVCDGNVTRPQRRDALRNRAALLDAAAELFAERGIDVTLDEVARHAGVGVGTAYRNFANKDVLIDALLLEQMSAMVALAEQAQKHEDPWLGLRGFLEQALEMQLAFRGLRQLVLARGNVHTRVDQARTRLAPTVDRLVARAQAAGALRPDLAGSDIAMLNVMLGTLQDVSREVAPELYRRYLEIALRGLRADGPLPGPPLDPAQLDTAMRTWHER